MKYIEERLHHGKENALDGKALLKLTGFLSIRELQREIERERRQGVLIISDFVNGGYHLPSKQRLQAWSEISTFHTTLRAKAISTLDVLSHTRRALGLDEQQLTLDGWQ